MKIVNDWGDLYQMTERDYLRYLRAGIDGQKPSPKEFNGRWIGHITFESIDAKPSDYQDELDRVTTR